MKLLTLLLLLVFVRTESFAQELQTIDDLQSLELRVDENTLHAQTHLPNYRMGGGTGPTREILDCFLLDILDSDNQVTLDLKKRISKEIRIFQNMEFSHELESTVKGNNIVFQISKKNFYVTRFTVKSRSGRSFKEVLKTIMPPTHSANHPARVNLLYVRDCRL